MNTWFLECSGFTIHLFSLSWQLLINSKTNLKCYLERRKSDCVKHHLNFDNLIELHETENKMSSTFIRLELLEDDSVANLCTSELRFTRQPSEIKSANNDFTISSLCKMELWFLPGVLLISRCLLFPISKFLLNIIK